MCDFWHKEIMLPTHNCANCWTFMDVIGLFFVVAFSFFENLRLPKSILPPILLLFLCLAAVKQGIRRLSPERNSDLHGNVMVFMLGIVKRSLGNSV